MSQRSAHLHPVIEDRTLACAKGYGAHYSELCNAALYLFLESGDEAQADALRVVSGMRVRARQSTRRMSDQSRAAEARGHDQSRERERPDNQSRNREGVIL
jgi:hypothetical protein